MALDEHRRPGPVGVERPRTETSAGKRSSTLREHIPRPGGRTVFRPQRLRARRRPQPGTGVQDDAAMAPRWIVAGNSGMPEKIATARDGAMLWGRWLPFRPMRAPSSNIAGPRALY